MSDPVFKVGDEVECEFNFESNSPRWNFESDSGATGKFLTGKITSISKAYLNVKLVWSTKENKERSISWDWPVKGHTCYSEDQWSRPGYLRHKQKEVIKYRLVECTEGGKRFFRTQEIISHHQV